MIKTRVGLWDLFRLLRVEQWYKNSIIFVSLLFSFNLFNIKLVFLTFFGFISLCFISSSYYILNDIIDIEKDKNHPEKKNRPLASGKITILTSLIISLVLFNISMLISYNLSTYFLISVLSLFLITQVYTFMVKYIVFLDIISISINFVIRAISGTFIIHEPVSAWVVLSTFFLSTFLISSKRKVEVSSDFITKYRAHFKTSDKEVLTFFSIFSITAVFIFFSIYSILTNKTGLLISLPLSIYIVLVFFQSMNNEPEKIRNPEKFIFDKNILLSLLFWLILVIIGFYFI